MENVDLETQEYGNDLKVILVGNVSTGKTSIVDRYINNTFREKIKATISPNFQYKLIKKNGIIYRLHFWDIPGQDRNPTLTSVFCRDAQGFVFCCDALVEKSRNELHGGKSSRRNMVRGKKSCGEKSWGKKSWGKKTWGKSGDLLYKQYK